MIRYLLEYSDGTTKVKFFTDQNEAKWFIHNEGDHLVGSKLIIDEQYDPYNGGCPTFIVD